MKAFMLMTLIFASSFAIAQDFSAHCTSVRDPDCQSDPRYTGGRTHTARYPGGLEGVMSEVLRPSYWTNNGIFTARGYGTTCDEAREHAEQVFEMNFDYLCRNGGRQCRRGFRLKDHDCYRSGNQLVAYIECDNTSEWSLRMRPHPRPRRLGTCGPRGCL